MIKYQTDELQAVTDSLWKIPAAVKDEVMEEVEDFIIERRSLRASKYNFNTQAK